MVFRASDNGERVQLWTKPKNALSSCFDILNLYKIARKNLALWRQKIYVPKPNHGFQKILPNDPKLGKEDQVDSHTRSLED